MTSCPCCGSEVSRPVIVSLDTNTISTPMGSAKVRPLCASLVSVLLERYPNTVSFDEIGIGLWGQRYYEMSQYPCNMEIHRARKDIAVIGLTIENLFGVGYRLSTSKTEGA